MNEQLLYDSRPTYGVRALGVAAVAVAAASALLYLVNVGLLWAVAISMDQIRSSASLIETMDRIETAANLENLVPVATILAGLGQLAVVVLTMIWLWRTRKNLDAFPGAQPVLSPGFAIGGWFIPVANLVIPGRMMANVARQSSREFWVTAAAIVWWVGLIANLILDRVATVLADNRAKSIGLDLGAMADHYRDWAVLETVAGAAAILAAVAYTIAVPMISAAQEQRINASRLPVMGVTLPPGAPTPGGSATIGA